jgi:SAM-dependent methyltransferase
LIAIFALAALASAFLLFWVEPLFTKLVLPLLGGSPAVWNTCLMYFQALLLLGYLYAHASTRYLSARRQVWVHVALLGVALFALPVAIPRGWAPPASGSVIPWLLLLLTVALGAPFLVLSATAPLLQHWFARLDHPAAEHPYALYAASNAGSFLGLLAFPILLEPHVRLGQQSSLWSAGYVLALVLTAMCGVVAFRRQRRERVSEKPAAAPDIPSPAAATLTPGAPEAATTPNVPAARDRVRWIALAFVPSSLLLGVTTYLSTDVAAAPFLWVVPLALYLLTFVIVFSRRSRKPVLTTSVLHALLVMMLVGIVFWDVTLEIRWAYPLHLGLFAITALVLHGELAASRPSPSHLTEYYLWMAVGGALGGAFNAIIAPLVFHSIAEYQAMVVLACFLRPSWWLSGTTWLDRARGFATALIPALMLGLVVAYGVADRRVLGIQMQWIVSGIAAAIVLALSGNAAWFGASLAVIALTGFGFSERSSDLLYADRSFFGVYRVERPDSRVTMLLHGTTIHGAQFIDPARRREPLTYYHVNGPIGQLFHALQGRLERGRVGVVGLGAGSLLCYATPGQDWTFFEIDPHVEAIARNPKYFSFLKDCAVQTQVVIGDARLTLARMPNARFDLLILDAFSSDAIPVHLLTREAIAVYERVLDEHGILVIHISNRHLNLAPVVGALAADARLVGWLGEHEVDAEREDGDFEYSCDWVVLTRRPDDAGPLITDSRWRPIEIQRGRPPWTDDYSNVLSAIDW